MEKILSIVIANYNYGRFLETAIRSVLDQNNDQIELIVVDGGSSDESVDIINRYSSRLAWWVSEKDKGQSDAFNKGFAHANGRYLTWLNADDVLVPGCLDKIIDTMRAHPECEWFTGNFFRFTEDGRVTVVGWGPNYYPHFLQRRNSPIVVYGPTSFFSKKIYDEVGGINNDRHYIMDTDMWMRFIVRGIKQCRIRCFCWGFRMHEASKTAEFGDHSVSPETFAKISSERAQSREETGYQTSRWMRKVIKLWQVVDGSLFTALWLRVSFRTFKGA